MSSHVKRFADEDEAHEYCVQKELEAEAEATAKLAAAGLSPEELSLIDAGNEGRRAGMFGHGASMNPYSDPTSPEFQEWEKHRLATIAARLSGRLAA